MNYNKRKIEKRKKNSFITKENEFKNKKTKKNTHTRKKSSLLDFLCISKYTN